MVTGGLGALGSLVGSWAAAQGAGHILLLGRSASKSSSGNASLERLKTGATLVTMAMCDVACTDDCAALDRLMHGRPHVFHAGMGMRI